MVVSAGASAGFGLFCPEVRATLEAIVIDPAGNPFVKGRGDAQPPMQGPRIDQRRPFGLREGADGCPNGESSSGRERIDGLALWLS